MTGLAVSLPPVPKPAQLLSVRSITKSFDRLAVLQSVSLRISCGQVVGLIGPNGSGKSTLFDIITGFQRSDEGQIIFRDRPIVGLAPDQIARRGLMRTFQMPEGGQRLTAFENLLSAAPNQNEHNLAIGILRLRTLRKRERENVLQAEAILDFLGLSSVKNEYVGNLSGGQRKLIDLGRVFMARPSLSLLDEPTAGVNPALIQVVLDNLRRMNREGGISLLIVEHNMQVIRELCDYVYVLDAGTLICEGAPEAVQSDERVLEIYLGRSRKAME
jgi:ABC-type branched-subunit amino acid transport system ATPase component